jgi:hypothetical protein
VKLLHHGAQTQKGGNTDLIFWRNDSSVSRKHHESGSTKQKTLGKTKGNDFSISICTLMLLRLSYLLNSKRTSHFSLATRSDKAPLNATPWTLNYLPKI